MKARSATGVVFLLLIFLFLFLPRLVSEYTLNLIITMMIYSLFAVSYNILLGQAGLLSFGHAAYFGTGGYVTILLLKYLHCSILPAVFLGAAAGGLLGLAFGVFVVRLGGAYFALLTLAFNELIYAVAEKWRTVTGGEDGLAATRTALHVIGMKPIDMFPTLHWYYFTFFLVAVSIAVCWHLTHTPLGRLNECIRENEDRARFIGYNTYVTKLFIYVISTFFAGLAGALAASFQEFISTTFINLDKAADVLVMTFVGGTNVFFGPVLGAFFIIFLNDFISTITERWALIQGVIFILLVLYAPNGIIGIAASMLRSLRVGNRVAEEEG